MAPVVELSVIHALKSAMDAEMARLRALPAMAAASLLKLSICWCGTPDKNATTAARPSRR
eukprot:3155055-Pyramimonas_sp.AAC.1